MKAKKGAMVAILTLLVVGYACNGGTNTTKPMDTPGAFYGTYLFVDSCHTNVKVTKAVGVEIAAALASGVVKTGIDWIGTALQRAAQDDVEKTMVSSNLTSITQISESISNICLQMVRGEFKYASNYEEDDTDVYVNRFSIGQSSKVVAPLQVIEGTEDLFIEILPVIHNKVVSFTPLEVRYSGYTPSDRRDKKNRDLAIFIGYSLPDKDVSVGEYTGRLINFGTMMPNGNKQATIKYVTDKGELSLVNQTQWLSLPGDNDQPFTFAANIIETRKANQFSKFLAAAFKSSKEDIKNKTDAAVAELDMFKTSKALENEKLKLEKEKLTNEKTYFDAVATALKNEEALNELCSSKPIPTELQIYNAQKELYFSKKNANIAAASAGKSRLYSDSEIKTPDGKCGK
jgi:hypothetical protein